MDVVMVIEGVARCDGCDHDSRGVFSKMDHGNVIIQDAIKVIGRDWIAYYTYSK